MTSSPPERDRANGDGTVEVVTDAQALAFALAGVGSAAVGIDVERADAHRYYRRAALVQVGDERHSVLIDPLALDDFAPLEAFLADRVAVLHAVENDLEPLAAIGVRIAQLADTAVAAAVLGLPTGLSALLEEVLAVTLSPDKDRFQRANWEQRPLPADMVAYAAADVRHLPPLWAALRGQLAATGRTAWYEQELAATLRAAQQDRRDWKRLRGIGRLSPTQRAVVRHLWEEREAIARRHDLAPGRLLKDHTLVDLGANPATSRQELLRRNRRRTAALRAHAEALLAAQRRGTEAEPEAGSPADAWDEADRRSYNALRRSRAVLAAELAIDPGLLCPSRSLRRAVARRPGDADELCELAGMRPWQRELLRDRLWAEYLQSRARIVDDD